MNRRTLLGAGAGLVAFPAILSAQAPAWPSRGPIRLVAQFPPGGLVDTVARLMAPIMAQELGQSVVVENRPGAAGLIGSDFVSKQAPDGYTLLMSHAIVHVYSPATRRTMPFDPIGDFTHMAMLVEAPMVLLVRGDSPFRTLAQYLETAKRQPVRYGSSGIGSATHLVGELLKREAGAGQLEHVPYQGTAPAMQDLLARVIESMLDPITTNVGQLRDGSLRALAVSSPERLAAFPDLPTFAELGFSSLTSSQWLGLSGPKGLPQPIVDRLVAMLPGILARPELLARLEDVQTLPRKPLLVGEAFVAEIRRQIEHWRAVARAANIEVT
ncbi:MAG: tripartite tricarboxylate transporter substrate binding protein [Acetobacteraceae bacterium]